MSERHFDEPLHPPDDLFNHELRTAHDAELQAEIDACPDCDASGYTGFHHNRVCDHQQQARRAVYERGRAAVEAALAAAKQERDGV